MAHSYPDGKPRLYAKEKLNTLKGRKEHHQIGSATKEYAAIAFPGAHPDVFHGFTAFTTSPTEDTWPIASFHEIGLYQVEAGTKKSPVPNLDPNAEYGNWALLADSPLVRNLLGRSATMIDGAWKSAFSDQIAVGMANLRLHSSKMRKALAKYLENEGHPSSMLTKIVPSDDGSTWAVLWAFTAFSRGEGQFLKILKPYLTRLANEPEASKWRFLRNAVASDISSGTGGIGSKTGRSGAAYALIRSEQKFQSGYLLARMTAEDTAWFEPAYLESPEDISIEDTLTKCAYS